MSKERKGFKIGRSAIDGRFMTVEEAQSLQNKDKAVVEVIPIGKKKSKK
jgi:hypothetical protein